MPQPAVMASAQGKVLREDLALFCQPPGAMTLERLREIEKLILGGGAVDPTYVRHNLERAHLVAYALAGQRVVATVTLKHPRPEYVQRLKRRTSLDLSGYLERGYTSVHPDFSGRGLGTRMVSYLTGQAPGRKIYVVIAMQNLAAQAISIHCGTRLTARFTSRANGREYGIWIQGPPAEQP